MTGLSLQLGEVFINLDIYFFSFSENFVHLLTVVILSGIEMTIITLTNSIYDWFIRVLPLVNSLF